MLAPVPSALPAKRATLAANMETALNALWDSGAGAGDRIVVIGGGLVGLLVCFLACRLPGTEVVLVDPLDRSAIARAFGARWMVPEQARELQGTADLVFHTSANPSGLALGLELAAVEAKVIEMSWYGQSLYRWCSARLSMRDACNWSARKSGGFPPRTLPAGPISGAWPKRSICWMMRASMR